VVGGRPTGARSRDADAGSKRPEGKDSAARPGWLARQELRCGTVAMDGDGAPGVAAGLLGSFSPGESLMLAHRHSPGLGVRASRRTGRPIAHACECGVARGNAVRCFAGEEDRETDVGVPHVKEMREKDKAPVAGLRG
jgi:hypothetical protein